MAEIYKARLDGIGGFHRTFAIKRILPHLTARSEFVDMLVDEAKIAGLLSHANIVQILDLGQVSGTYYIAMEYVSGPDLGRVLRRCRTKGITLPVPHAVFIAIEMLKGLEYAHNRQVMRGGRPMPLDIVHRDVSPANVLVSFQGEVKLTDFGIAKASVQALETRAGVVKGRFNYMSPEQAAGLRPDNRTDLFAAGVVLYEMLTGQHPFIRKREPATLEAIRTGQFTPPSHVNPDIPHRLELIVEQALRPDVEERFQSATAMKEVLDRFFHDAGFIFSHSTLAAFLKGLFPEEAKGGPAEPDTDSLTGDSSSGDHTQPLPSHDGEERATQVDRPRAETGVPDPPFPTIDTHLGAGRVLFDGAPDMSRSGAFGPMAGIGDESTLVKGNPLLDGARAWSDAETVIKPDPGHLAEVAPPSPRETTRLRSADDSVDKPARRSRSRSSGLSRRLQLLYLAAGMVVTIIVLLVGFVIGHNAGRLTAPGSSPAVSVKSNPEVRVALPDGGRLFVDDREVSGVSPVTVELTPDSSHLLRVEIDGHQPVETRLTLDYNDVRLISVEAATATGQQH